MGYRLVAMGGLAVSLFLGVLFWPATDGGRPVACSARSLSLAAGDPAAAPLHCTYSIVRSYPHDPRAYTQGLAFDEGRLYEGTGLNGRSSLRLVELETGKILQQHDLPPDDFGEGIAVMGDRIYQLTWTSNRGFVYDKETFRLVQTFTYPTEGWGLTHDGSRLIMSDGTNTLHVIDPDTFVETARITVFDGAVPVTRLNELEYVNGLVYANVWQTDRIAVINPVTGKVVAWIYLANLLANRTSAADVLNGIAYDARYDRLVVTGKLWPMLFEIDLRPAASVGGEACRPGDGPISFAEDRGSYLVFNADELVQAGGFRGPWGVAYPNYQLLESALRVVHPADDAHFIISLVAGSDYCCNDRPFAALTTGIGFEHWVIPPRDGIGPPYPFPASPTASFDGTPTSQIEGVINLGSWAHYDDAGDFLGTGLHRLSQTLGQELGHQWLAYAYFRDSQERIRSDMVGNEEAHWAFYLDSDRSPMDGMDWQDNGDGTFTAPNKKPREGFGLAFSDIDLYLLGLISPSEARLTFLIENPHDCTVDGKPVPCPGKKDRALSLKGDRITVRGSRLDISADDIIAAEGPRVPDVAEARRDHRVIFVLFKPQGLALSDREYAKIGSLFGAMPGIWQQLTGGRSRLVDVSRTICPPAGS